MIQEMQKDQKPEEVQISFKVYVDHAKDGQNDTMSCKKGYTTHSPYLKGRTDKAEVQKDKNVSPRGGRSRTQPTKGARRDGGTKKSSQAPPDVWTGRSMRTHKSESRSAR